MFAPIVAVTIALLLPAQQPAQSPGTPTSGASASKVDPKLHDDVLKLIELSGARERLTANVPIMVEAGRKKMMETCQTCAPEFGEEWAKRMTARMKVQDFLDMTARAYEKYLTDAEVNELIALQKQPKSDPPATVSPALKQKLTSVMPSLMGEITGGSVEIAAKLGAEIGEEIEKEHPEYTRAAPAPAAKKEKE